MSKHWAFKWLVAAGMLALMQVAQAAAYQFLDVTPGGALYASVAGVNDAGQVVGRYIGASNEMHAFLYASGVFTDLGALGHGPGSPAYSAAYAINGAGQVVGVSDTSATSYDSRGHAYNRHAFLYSGALSDFRPNAPMAYTVISPFGINAGGHVVGQLGENDFYTQTDSRQAFFYANGQLTLLSTPGLSSWATGVNGQDQVSGTYTAANGDERAFIYQSGQAINLGALGGASSGANAINAFGQLTGYAQTAAGLSHAFLFSNGVMQDLGTLGGANSESVGGALNAQGQVVGSSAGRAFLYSGGRMVDLNDFLNPSLGWTLTDAVGINDQGVIVGQATVGGAYRSFMLTPVPEPSVLALVAGGLCVAGAQVKRRQSRRAS